MDNEPDLPAGEVSCTAAGCVQEGMVFTVAASDEIICGGCGVHLIPTPNE